MRRLAVPFTILTALQVLDVWTTYVVLSRGGVEANPIVAWAMTAVGSVLVALVLLKAGALAAVLLATRRVLARGLTERAARRMAVVCVIYCAVIANNLITLTRY